MRGGHSLVILLISTLIYPSLPAYAASQPLLISPAADTAAPTRIAPGEAPIIDGDLSDPAWAKAAIIDDLRQVEPNTGAPATERTVVRMMYDENNLYFSIYAYDSEPDLIIMRSMARDSDIYTGDNVGFTLDPGPTRRNAYSFQFGPSGGRNDSLILNNSQELDEWDPIWHLQTRIADNGWIAEIAIPFQSLSYEAGGADWGFEVSRTIRRKNEDVQWATQNPALDFRDVSQTGTLTGISNINRGLGLDIQVYGVGRAKHDWHIPGDGAGLSFTGGGNIFYRITPSLTGTLTFNPDFSDAPLDARQVNTTRFSLFFPETRDFFLHDAAAFEFGGRGFSQGFDRSANNGRPFFTRNIGLAGGEQVSIIGGGKLSGTFGGFGIGALTVLTDDTPSASGQFLSVARITRPVLGESKLGIVMTNGDPTGQSNNTVVGADFQYRNSNFSGVGILQSDFYFERSFSNTAGNDNAFGVALNLPNEPWGGNASFKQLGENFEPALGFANRVGIRDYRVSLYNRQRFPRPNIRVLEFDAMASFITDHDGRLETREAEVGIDLITPSDYEYALDVRNNFENILNPFDVAGVDLPIGRYSWTNFEARFESSDAEAISFGAEVACCSFYDGDGIEASAEIDFRPNQFYEIAAEWEGTFLDLPAGRVDIHVLTVNAILNFSPDMWLDMQVQYDNISKELGFLSRYRWEYSPGNEVFVAIGQTAEIPNSRFISQRSQVSVRLGRTFRY
jgi:hypothetical protein